MKLKTILLIGMTFLQSCFVYKPEFVSAEVAKNETLVTIYTKTAESGVIEFLRYEEEKYQLLVYSYRVDVKQNTSQCILRSNVYYKIGDNKLPKEWLTSSMLQQRKLYEKYFNCFTPNFLYLTNDEKIKVLDEISSGNGNR